MDSSVGWQTLIGAQVLEHDVMNLEFRRFQEDDYPEYSAWFSDPELNRRLGPMDREWLAVVLSQKESEGVTWAVLRDKALVAVIEVVFDPQGHLPAGITGIATHPRLRRQGIGTAVVQRVLHLHHNQGIRAHVAYVAADNEAARRFLERVGFVPTGVEPNEHGYVEFRHG